MSTTSIDDEIDALTLKRETIKLNLFEKEATRAKNKDRFIRFGEFTPIAERVALEADIACLEEDRQRSKLQMLRLKIQAKELRSNTLIQLLTKALEANGLKSEIIQAHKEATDAIKHSGLYAAYAANT